MGEAEWLAGPDLGALHGYEPVRSRVRKVRLFGCACVRSLAEWLADPVAVKALDAAERYADGLIKYPALYKWGYKVRMIWLTPGRQLEGVAMLVTSCIEDMTLPDNDNVMWQCGARLLRALPNHDPAVGVRAQAEFPALAREVFGNPFRPVAFDADWRTHTVAAVAHGIYAERAFDRLPVLADALDDAGCDAADLLAHLRGDGPHVRGCWALDLVLGKS